MINSKAFLVSFLAVITVLMLGFSSALSVSNLKVSFNDVVLDSSSTTIAGVTGETVPVRVQFTAGADAQDARVRIWVEGFRNELSDSTSRFNLVSGSTYSKLLSLELPSDLKNLTKSYTLYVRIADPTDNVEQEFQVKMQRESYSLDVLSVDSPLKVSAGDMVPVAVVVENNGMEYLDDGFVQVSIPALGVSSKAYFGDLSAVECDDCDEEDSVQKIVYLKLPEQANAGLYELEVKVYNKETVTSAKKIIEVDTSASTNLVSTQKNQEIRAGETKTYDLLIVNTGNNVKIYNLQTVSGNALIVSAPAVVTVGPQSSTTVPISVTASDKADLGSYTFSVLVDGKQTVFGAEIVEGSSVSNPVVVLTVILAIIFVVLLVVLIVLLVRRDKPAEEAETSYY